ncbi:MAG: hypothetical protein OEY97_10045 [Nitrospirota bacterium]|nr:hypothetical protein [Nitrospirota bacterium]
MQLHRWVVFTLALAAWSCGNVGSPSAPPVSACPAYGGTGGTLSISGTVRYEDYPYSATGLAATPVATPITGVLVQAIRCSDSAVLDQKTTGVSGTYTLTITNTGPAGIKIRALAQSPATLNHGGVLVRDRLKNTHAVVSPVFNETTLGGAPVNLLATEAAGGGAFNILDVALKGLNYLYANVSPNPGVLPQLVVNWHSGFSGVAQGASYFFSLTNELTILSDLLGRDTDEYDDPVVMHEVGHFISFNLSRENSQGGAHYMGDPGQDTRLSWSEGWGGFFSGAGLGNPQYIDTTGVKAGGGQLLAYNLETVQSDPFALCQDFPLGPIYSCFPGYSARGGVASENDVAATLWDAIDATPGEDPAAIAPGTVLNAILSLDTAYGISEPITFGRLWEVLVPLLTPTEKTNLETAAWTNGIDLVADGGVDDTVGGASVLTLAVESAPESLAIDPAITGTPDVDYYQVVLTEGLPYSFETIYYSNGADTLLTLVSPDGITTIASNDDWSGNYKSCSQYSTGCPNNGDDYSGYVEYTPPIGQGGTYFLKVERTPTTPRPYSGLYGTYTVLAKGI